jgi:hypothetical protein
MINNYRYAAYALLAIGLINLRYQTGNANNLNTSSVLIVLGVLGLLITFIPPLKSLLLKKSTQIIALTIFVAAIVYGFAI